MFGKLSRRKVYLINPRFQLAFLAYTVGIALVTAGIFYCSIVYFFWRFRDLGVEVGLQRDHMFFQFINQQQSVMNWGFAIGGVVAVLTICVSGLLLSHKVAGPLYRLQKHMLDVANRVTQGEVKFRKGDFFNELADSYNSQLKTLKEDKRDAA